MSFVPASLALVMRTIVCHCLGKYCFSLGCSYFFPHRLNCPHSILLHHNRHKQHIQQRFDISLVLHSYFSFCTSVAFGTTCTVCGVLLSQRSVDCDIPPILLW